MAHCFRKNCLLIVMAGILVNNSVQAFSWGSLRSITLHAHGYAISHQSSFKIIGACGAAITLAAGICIGLLVYRKLTWSVPLVFEDPDQFLTATEARVAELEGAVGEDIACLPFPATIKGYKQEAEKMLDEVSRIVIRGSDTFYNDQADALKLAAVKARHTLQLLNPEGTNVPKFLGISRDASHESFLSALESYKRRLGVFEKYQETLRQIDDLGRSSFGWENYRAFLYGRRTVAQLPRADRNRIADLSLRINTLKNRCHVLARSNENVAE